MPTLQTPNEVKKAANLPDEVSACTVQDIRTAEYNLFAKETVGISLAQYKDLLDSLADYSSAADYSNSTNYTANTVVKYHGLYYKALVNTVGVSPLNANNWTLAPKFDGANAACYNALWCDGSLRDVIAYMVVYNTMPQRFVQFTGAGLVKRSDTRMEAIDVDDFKASTEGYFNYMRMSVENLIAYIANGDAPCLAVDVEGAECTTCGGTILNQNSNIRPHYLVG